MLFNMMLKKTRSISLNDTLLSLKKTDKLKSVKFLLQTPNLSLVDISSLSCEQ